MMHRSCSEGAERKREEAEEETRSVLSIYQPTQTAPPLYNVDGSHGHLEAGASETNMPLSEPLYELFVEVFQLKENNWLRRQAVIIILQQILGGTIER